MKGTFGDIENFLKKVSEPKGGGETVSAEKKWKRGSFSLEWFFISH